MENVPTGDPRTGYQEGGEPTEKDRETDFKDYAATLLSLSLSFSSIQEKRMNIRKKIITNE